MKLLFSEVYYFDSKKNQQCKNSENKITFKKLSHNSINENKEDSSDNEINLVINTVMEIGSIISPHQKQFSSQFLTNKNTQQTLVWKIGSLNKIPSFISKCQHASAPIKTIR